MSKIGTVQDFDWKQLVDMPAELKDFEINGEHTILNFSVLTDATDTTTSTSANVVKTVVLADIVRYAQEQARLLNAFKQYVAPENTKSIKIPITSGNLTFDEQSAAWGTTTYETEVRDWTEITNLNTVEFTYRLYKYGAVISKEFLKTCAVDLIAEGKNQLAFTAAKEIDDAIAAALAGATPAKSLYGGDATTTSTVANGDILTTDLIADAIIELDEEGWENTPDAPYILFIHPKQKGALLKDSQFVNASEYGSNEVVLRGEIGNYLGVKIVTTTRVTDLGAGTAATSAHECYLVKSQVCGGLVWFEKPNMSGEYDMERAAAKVYLDMAYAADTLQDKAIVHIEVSDA